MKKKLKTHYRMYPAGPPPHPINAWTRCGRTVPYKQAANDLKDVDCLKCKPYRYKPQD